MKKFGTAVILAGGKSTRMGFDKQFLVINRRRLIDSLRKKLKKEFDEIVVVTNKSQYYLGFTDKSRRIRYQGKGLCQVFMQDLWKLAASLYTL